MKKLIECMEEVAKLVNITMVICGFIFTPIVFFCTAVWGGVEIAAAVICGMIFAIITSTVGVNFFLRLLMASLKEESLTDNKKRKRHHSCSKYDFFDDIE